MKRLWPTGLKRAHYPSTSNNLLKFYNDASEDPFGRNGAFSDIRTSIEAAEHFIFIVDWSFHPRLRLRRELTVEESVGEMLLRKAKMNQNMLVAIMPWFHSEYVRGLFAPTGDRDNNNGVGTLVALNHGQALPTNLLYEFAEYGRTRTYSHHQKFVVLDAPARVGDKSVRVVKAFFGGLDLTRGRFDWHEHHLWNSNSVSFVDDWYNGEFGNSLQMMREPWHDVHAQLVGPSAWDFAIEFVARWASLDKKRTDAVPFEKILDLWKRGVLLRPEQMEKDSIDSTGLTGGFGGQVLRSIAKSAWTSPPGTDRLTGPEAALKVLLTWSPEKEAFERSIQDGYLEMISEAKDFIYIETQFLISSGADWKDTVYRGERPSVENRIAHKLVEKIEEKLKRDQEFHVYIVLPMYPEGTPAETGPYEVRYLQWCTIEYMIMAVAGLCEKHGGGKTWSQFLSFYCLANWENEFPGPEHLPLNGDGKPDWTQLRLYGDDVTERRDKLSLARRYMIYVHSKMMIVDDDKSIIGSANLNERSLNGNRDSEIAMALWANDDDARAAIKDLRKRLWTEHQGAAWMAEKVYKDKPNWELGAQTTEGVEVFRAAAQHNFLQFMRGERPASAGHIIGWPIQLLDGKLVFDVGLATKVPNKLIPDYPEANKQFWHWVSDWSYFGQLVGTGRLAE